MKPTPEQVEAAKAWTKCDESSRQHALLLGSHTHDSMGRIAAEILLAALEAAEADSARLDWLNEHPESVLYLDDGFWRILYEVSGAGGFGGGVGEMHHRTLRGVIDAARKEAQP